MNIKRVVSINKQFHKTSRGIQALGSTQRYIPRYSKPEPVIETNLEQKDLNSISKKIGEAIASVVIDEIISSQSSKPVPL